MIEELNVDKETVR